MIHVFSPVFAFYACIWHFLCSPFIVGALIDTAKMVALATVILGVLMVHPRTRRATCAIVKFTNRHAPRWARPAMVACALFPGQADEIVLVAILLFPILRNARNRRAFVRSVRYAWRG